MRLSALAAAVPAILAVAILAAGCGGSPTSAAVTPTPTVATPAPTVAANDSIQVNAMVPTPGTTLTRGDTVTFTATVKYTLATADTGNIFLILENQDEQLIQNGPQANAPITRGDGEVTVSQTLEIPRTGVSAVKVFIAMFPTGTTRTQAFASVTFQVP